MKLSSALSSTSQKGETPTTLLRRALKDSLFSFAPAIA
jgi:hypothetical protein